MTNNIKISVILPVYNVDKYLKQCLESIINQTFSDIEIICIDDGSKDNSLKILKEYQKIDKRIVIINEKHLGVWNARNVGIKKAKGKYIQFLDSDDYFELDLLEKLYKKAEKFQTDIIICSSREVDNEGNILVSKNPNSPINLDKIPFNKVFNSSDFQDDIFSLLTPIPWNKLFLREFVIKNNLLFPKLNICEDVAFIHSAIACAKKIVVINNELINYRQKNNIIEKSYRAKHTIDVVKTCLILQDFLKRNNLYDNLKNAFWQVFRNHVRWEIALCNDDEYQNFLKQLKEIMPDWEKLKSALKKDYITLDYLNKFIGNKKVMLWGASTFLKKLLINEQEINPNILGIIDRNEASWGKMCGNYKIYPPDSLISIKPDGVLMTIWSNYETIYPDLQKEFKLKYSDIELLPNIFE